MMGAMVRRGDGAMLGNLFSRERLASGKDFRASPSFEAVARFPGFNLTSSGISAI
jgi:hypothetical protein